MTTWQFPWESARTANVAARHARQVPKRRGRRPATRPADDAAPAWRCHILTISGPAPELGQFAEAARGAGVLPWRIDGQALEEDLFHLAAGQGHRSLSLEGCRILSRQLRNQVETRHAVAAASVGQSRACPFDLHSLLPVPPHILQLGPRDPAALAWLAAHWGITDTLRHVAAEAGRPRGLPAGHAAGRYSFFTADAPPQAAVTTLAERWPTLRLRLQIRASD